MKRLPDRVLFGPRAAAAEFLESRRLHYGLHFTRDTCIQRAADRWVKEMDYPKLFRLGQVLRVKP